MIRIEKRLTIGGAEFPLASDRVELELGAVGQGFFHVTADPTGNENALALFSAGYGARTFTSILAGVVADAQPVQRGEWRVVVKEFAGALDAQAAFALRHPTPGDVLQAIENLTGLNFLLPAVEAPAPGHYLSRRLPYFYAPGTCRQALDAMAQAWGVADGLWATLPDGRIYWGAWGESPLNADPLSVPAELVLERDPEARAFVLPYMPRLRPGLPVAVKDFAGGEVTFLVKRASLLGDKARLEWGEMAA